MENDSREVPRQRPGQRHDRKTTKGPMQYTIFGANLGPMVNTCFAILFLKRATAPVIRIPEETTTGTDLFGGGRHRQGK